MHIESNDIFVLKIKNSKSFISVVGADGQGRGLTARGGRFAFEFEGSLCTHFALGRTENQQDAGADEPL